jgi:hypothetical protein
MGGIRLGSINRAYFSALGFVVETYALNAFLRVNYIRSITLVDGANRAFRFASPATNAIICNLVSHTFPPESNIENTALPEIY